MTITRVIKKTTFKVSTPVIKKTSTKVIRKTVTTTMAINAAGRRDKRELEWIEGLVDLPALEPETTDFEDFTAVEALDASDTEISFEESGPAVSTAEPAVSGVDRETRLFARHVCPVCPEAAADSQNGRHNVQYCCPARSTVTAKKTRRITSTIKKSRTTTILKTSTKTITSTVLVNNVTGRLFQDMDGNGIFNAPPDAPVGNTPVALVFVQGGATTTVPVTRTTQVGVIKRAAPWLVFLLARRAKMESRLISV